AARVGWARWAASSRWPERILVSISAIAGSAGDAVVAAVIPAVAGFGERVRAEGGELLGGQKLLEAAILDRVVEVVHPLGALVAEPAVLLEVPRACHRTVTL